MLDIKFIRENPDIVKENIKKKFQDEKLPLVDEVIELDSQRRANIQEADQRCVYETDSEVSHMRDPFMFDSRSEFGKKPFGAVPCGSEVMFHVRPLTRDGYSRCVLVARREFSGEEIQMELLPEAVDGERTRFTGILTAPTEPELLWYHFRLIRSDGSTALLDQSGWKETGEIQSWQLTVYEKTATPLWLSLIHI